MDLSHIQNTSIPITNAEYKQYCDLHQTWMNMVMYLLKEYNKKDANIFSKIETTVMPSHYYIDYMNRASVIYEFFPIS